MLSPVTYEQTTAGMTAATKGPGGIVRHGAGECGSMALLQAAVCQRMGIPFRNVVSSIHIFIEPYFDDVGWVNPFCDETGTQGHTIHIGGNVPQLDLLQAGHWGAFGCQSRPTWPSAAGIHGKAAGARTSFE